MMTVDFTPIFLSLLPLFLATGTLLGLALQNAETTSTATTPNIRWSQLLYRPEILKNTLRIAMSSTKFWTKSCKHQITKGQLISEWIYKVTVFPKIRTKNCQDFCPHYTGQISWQFFVRILGETMTSWSHSEKNWPLDYENLI